MVENCDSGRTPSLIGISAEANLLQPYRLDYHVLGGEVVAVGGNSADGVEHFQSLGHLAEGSVLSVELRHRLKANKELATIGGSGGVDCVG